MRWMLVLAIVTGCIREPVPCDTVIDNEDDEYGQDCAELDMTSTIPFDYVQFVMGTSVITTPAIETPEMLASGEPPPASFAEFRLVWPESSAFETPRTTFVTTQDGGGDGFDDRVLVVASRDGVPVASGMIHLSYVDRDFESYLVGAVDLDAIGPTVERWGIDPETHAAKAIPCVRVVEPDRTTYFLDYADADCDGIYDGNDRQPAIYDPPSP